MNHKHPRNPKRQLDHFTTQLTKLHRDKVDILCKLRGNIVTIFVAIRKDDPKGSLLTSVLDNIVKLWPRGCNFHRVLNVNGELLPTPS